jgi:pimeloyl-ACP methyl ester carboxylesterase
VKPTIESVTCDDGPNLFAFRWEGEAAPFVLVHGLASNGRTWLDVARHLAAAGHAVVAYDQRGHGRSQRPPTGYDHEGAIGDLRTVIDATESHRPIVVGQSWGGNLVVEMAARHSEEVTGVATVDGGTIDLNAAFPDWETAEQALTPPGTRPGTLADARRMLRTAHPDWPERGVEATLANLEETEDGVRNRLALDAHMSIVRSMWENPPSRSLPLVEAPVVLIPAENDHRGPIEARRQAVAAAAEALPRARVRWIEGDHDLHVQQPETVAATLLEAVRDGWFA